MTESRRHSSSDHAFEAVYHPIPQAPVASEPFRPSLELSSEESDVELDSANPPVEVDARIRWIHFVLGCAVLLPWNGMMLCSDLW